MAAFNLDEVNDQDGGISLYWRMEFLDEDLKWFASHRYQILSFNTGDWKSEEVMHEALQTGLSFPHYYGKNLNALDDCLWNDLDVPDAGGLAIVLTHFDSFARTISSGVPEGYTGGEIVLDCFARAIRYRSLLGKRLVVSLAIR
jgi:RNAse (barnase) inhibitor barstar